MYVVSQNITSLFPISLSAGWDLGVKALKLWRLASGVSQAKDPLTSGTGVKRVGFKTLPKKDLKKLGVSSSLSISCQFNLAKSFQECNFCQRLHFWPRYLKNGVKSLFTFKKKIPHLSMFFKLLQAPQWIDVKLNKSLQCATSWNSRAFDHFHLSKNSFPLLISFHVKCFQMSI